MTLSPVFRSDEAVAALKIAGVWRHLQPAARGQRDAIARVLQDLPTILDSRYFEIETPLSPSDDAVGIEFVQQYFFLILFRSVLQTVGVTAEDLELCSELNFCIKGTITAADNLFDDQDKTLLPLRACKGSRFRSILQLLAFEKLTGRALDRGCRAGSISAPSAAHLQRELLSKMAAIGSLEGSEETGVDGVLEPGLMVDHVHRLRGGALFELAFVAPRWLERSVSSTLLSRALWAISRLGTAFQIVDDLTDFEVDLARGSHNLLVSQITHRGTPEEQARLRTVGARGEHPGDLELEAFSASAKAVVALGENEARLALEELRSLGFWFPPELSPQLVRAIVGADDVERMRRILSASPTHPADPAHQAHPA